MGGGLRSIALSDDSGGPSAYVRVAVVGRGGSGNMVVLWWLHRRGDRGLAGIARMVVASILMGPSRRRAELVGVGGP